MKKINTLSLALTYAGCFLGAGYVSGQELFSFFASYGKRGIASFIFAIILHIFFGIILLLIVSNTGKTRMDEVVVPVNSYIMKNAVGFLTVFFMYGVFITMTAGFGALVRDIFGIPPYISNLVFCVVICILATKGMDALVKVFSLLVPILVAVSVFISILAVIEGGKIPEIKTFSARNTGLISSNAFLSGVTYVSYNLLSSIGVLIPLGKRVVSRKTVFSGITVGSLMLSAIGLGLIFAMFSFPDSFNEELPMLYVSRRIAPVLSYVYAFLLFCGIFGTSLSTVVGVTEYLGTKFSSLNKKRTLIIIISCAVSYTASLAGFSDLISTVYPLFGYMGFVVLLFIIICFIKSERMKNKASVDT